MNSRLAAPLLAAALALGSCGGSTGASAPALVLHPGCQKTEFEKIPLTLCVADPAVDTIRTALGPPDGEPWRSLASFSTSRAPDAPPVAFALNAGMFDDDGEPIGYYVEGGDKKHALNRNQGPGNFHMLPNGVFYGSAGKWHVASAEDFFAHVTERPDFGTQSGPMLVIDGQLHPKIDPDGKSLRIRNAVGIDCQGRALFVISDQPLSFGTLARFYRDELRVKNALFLDGTVSSLWDPKSGRLDNGIPIGPLIVVEKRSKAGAKDIGTT
ncbi:MAG: phosphodiester glycosidase family protein [Candidatus Andeanibacterium colombiense]|uniref:Phosphodiester glycosidase family protein n=1 Tax=Candidatus Andeanibacterium colombiense TaxID=3121345 RepID=A0AAJ6BND0_9SPHN|nr:MAG: phosphodiester glycosidase family protein [Sphingomonadaceae bacterium]